MCSKSSTSEYISSQLQPAGMATRMHCLYCEATAAGPCLPAGADQLNWSHFSYIAIFENQYHITEIKFEIKKLGLISKYRTSLSV